jgi:hypothetical protein
MSCFFCSITNFLSAKKQEIFFEEIYYTIGGMIVDF